MIISGTGITTFTARIKPDFTVSTVLALKWQQLSSGNWYATDRLNTADMYQTQFRLYGKETVINAFVNQVEYNRVAGSNTVQMSGFNSTEHIFGTNVDYSGTLNATLELDRRVQNTWKGWQLTCKATLLAPVSFVGASSLPLFLNCDIGVDADADRNMSKAFTYTMSPIYMDHVTDAGQFKGTFNLHDVELQGLRNFIRTNRGATISLLALPGILQPFGRLTPSAPYSVKILAVENETMWGVERWTVDITFALVR
jgi:hypothetical protein